MHAPAATHKLLSSKSMCRSLLPSRCATQFICVDSCRACARMVACQARTGACAAPWTRAAPQTWLGPRGRGVPTPCAAAFRCCARRLKPPSPLLPTMRSPAGARGAPIAMQTPLRRPHVRDGNVLTFPLSGQIAFALSTVSLMTFSVTGRDKSIFFRWHDQIVTSICSLK